MTQEFPQVIFHDIDGCLNPHMNSHFGTGQEGTLSSEQTSCLEEFALLIDNSPVKSLVLNTGRDYEDTAFIAKAIPSKKLRYLIVEHGAYGWDLQEDHIFNLEELAQRWGSAQLKERYAELEQIKKIMEWYREEGRIQLERTFGSINILGKEANLSLQVPEGFSADHLLSELKTCLLHEFKHLKDKLQFCHSQRFVDVLGQIHKSDGALLFCQYLGINAEQSLVVGDGLNDVDIFSIWPNLLCPANAHQDVIRLCHERGGTVSEYDCIQASNHFLKNCMPAAVSRTASSAQS
ncbi:MAG: HAD hydrolase family protein [Planctomycetes bacterium]|nr:HAD hydrolase family protein [Planctomycetota bacterium]